jgi:hypothetical protein
LWVGSFTRIESRRTQKELAIRHRNCLGPNPTMRGACAGLRKLLYKEKQAMEKLETGYCLTPRFDHLSRGLPRWRTEK